MTRSWAPQESRAAENHILYNYLSSEAARPATSSTYRTRAAPTIGNIIQQGPGSQNAVLLPMARRRPPANPRSELLAAHNTFVNQRHWRDICGDLS
jgi:hypothetical protein